VGDRNNHRIRKVTRAGVVTTVAGAGTAGTADGAAGVAQFNTPRGVAVASDGTIYVADSNNNRIRRVTPSGDVSTLAGSTQGFADGAGNGALFNGAWGIALADDDTLYVADALNHRIRRVSTVDGTVETVAGNGTPGSLDGTGASALFNTPTGITVGADGALYVSGGGRVRRVTLDGTVTTVAGGTMGFANGTGAAARFNHPRGLALAPDGSLLIADRMNHCVRVLR
jgi:sugar lactone lactonase YvrE